ncbi:MAG TPA: ATP-binding protein, partial [Pyrinomonadaceae bacterium]|nr:ATP-binding protein [Pyrinomonadaceae bacterium]
MLVVLHLFVLFLLVMLGFYVFVSEPRRRAHQTFAAFIAFLALWTTKDLIFWNFYDDQTPWALWAASSFIIALLMQCALVVFAWVFPENSRTPRRLAAIVFSPSLILIPAAIFGLLWRRVGIVNGKFDVELTLLAYAFVIYVYATFFYGAAILWRKYKKYKGTLKGQQLGAILGGLAATGVLKTIAVIVLPFFGVYDLLPISAVFVLPGVVVYAFAILNFKLFSFQSALDQFRLFPLTYKIALSIASVAITSFILFQIPIVWWAFRNGMNYEAWRRYLVFSLISALVPNLLLVLLVLRSISRPLQRITVAAVAVTNGEYGTEVDMRRTNDEMGLLADSFNEMSRKMAVDIEELRRLNEQLVRTERLAAMGTLAAGVAHEVNNPLASISSLIQMMQANSDIDTATKDKLQLISEQIRRITRVTKDMTDFARVRPVAKKEINVNHVIKSSLRLAEFDKAFQSLDVHTELDETIPAVVADADQLQQVFLNLLLNARDAMPPGSKLGIKSSQVSSEVRVSVSDSGCGINDSDSKQIFDPFFTTKAPGKGTGLGLAICYGIVTAHGGRIEVESRNGQGSTFHIIL